ncbi:MAG: hypothetical protein WCI02_10925 [Planctomycetota bacterium]
MNPIRAAIPPTQHRNMIFPALVSPSISNREQSNSIKFDQRNVFVATMGWIAMASLAMLSVSSMSSVAVAETPVLALDAIYPPVLSSQRPNSVKVASGRFTQDVDQLIFSTPLIQATLDTAPNLPLDAEPQKLYGSFTITVDPALAEGYYEVWAVGRYGVSNPRTLAIVHAPVEPLPTSSDPTQLAELKSGICYFGQTRRNERLAFRLKPLGKWPHIAIAAADLDSLAIPNIKLLDGNDQLLYEGHATGRQTFLIGQPQLAAKRTVVPDELHLAISDFLFRGGENFGFAMMIDPSDQSPLVRPVSLHPPSAITIESLPNWPVHPVSADGFGVMPSPPWQTSLEIGSDRPAPALEFTPVENGTYELEVFSTAQEPSHELRAVVDRVAPPPTLEQRISIESALQAPAGSLIAPEVQQLIDTLRSRERMTGREVVLVADEAPPTGTRAVRFGSADVLATIPGGPANKNVRITLFDLQKSRSSKQPTHVTLRVGPAIPRLHGVAHWSPDSNNPGTAKTTGSSILRGGTASLHVSIRRAGGLTAPVHVSLEGLPPGLVATPAVIHPNQTEAELILYSEETTAPWVGPISAIARTTTTGPDQQPLELTVPMRAASIYAGASPDRGLPQSRLSSQLLLKVVEQDIAPVQIRANDGNVLEIAQGAAAKLPIKAIRRTGGEAKCVLRPQNLPPKVSLGEFELAPSINEAAPEIKIAADAPIGEYTVWFQGEMTVKQSLHPESHIRAVAYRDRLQSQLADPSWMGDRPALEKGIADANARIETLSKEIAPRDFPTFFPTASFRLRILAAPEAAK